MGNYWEFQCSFEILDGEDRDSLLERVINAVLDVIDANCNEVCERDWAMGGKIVDDQGEVE